MGLLQKLGGRKFIMAIIAGGFASYLEVGTAKGLSPTMAGFLVALVGSFSVVNHLATKSYEESRSGSNDNSDGYVGEQIEQLSTLLSQASNNGEVVKQYLGTLNESIAQVQATAGQLGIGMVNMNKEIQQVKRAVVQPTF